MVCALSSSPIHLLRRAAIAVVVLAVPASAGAVCTGPPIDFSENLPVPTCAGGYCYVVSPNDPTHQTLVGSFWALGFGDPALNAGTDNGAFAVEDGWVYLFAVGRTLTGSWSQSNAIDGCIDGKIAPGKNTEIMAVEFSDRESYAYGSDFAVAAVSRHASSSPQFDFGTGIGSDITLRPLQSPEIASSTPVPPLSYDIGVGGPTAGQLAPGFYSDGSTELQDVVAGYRVYGVPSDGQTPPPSVLRESGWAPLTGVVPLGEVVHVTFECTQLYQYLAYALVYDSGFESRYLSPRTPPITCELCLGPHDNDADGWPSTSGGDCARVDCDDGDPDTYPHADEINDGRDNQCPGDLGFGIIDEISGVFGFNTAGDKQTLSWPAQNGATSYQVARSEDRAFVSGCTAFMTAQASFADTAVPSPQFVFYYLVRPTAPLTGSWGTDSAGVERSTACP